MADFLDEGRIKNLQVVEIARKVKIVVDKADEYAAKVPVTTEIVTGNRGKFSRKVERLQGNPNYSMSEEDFYKKIRSCARYAARPEIQDNVGEIIEVVNFLEEVDEVNRLVLLLT